MRVESENPMTEEIRLTTKAYLTFVSIDEFGNPKEVPDLKPESEDEIRRYKNAQERMKSNKELHQKLKREDSNT